MCFCAEEEASGCEGEGMGSLGGDLIDVISQPQSTGKIKHDPQIMVDGTYVYKATILKNAFSDSPLSRDRLRRVQGLTKFITQGNESNANAIEDAIMVGDPLIIFQKEISPNWRREEPK